MTTRQTPLPSDPARPGYVLDNRAGMIPIPQWYWSLGAWDSQTVLEWHGPYLLKSSAVKDAEAAVRGEGS